MKYTVVVRAKLKGERQAMKQYHDEVTKATRAQAQQAGDLRITDEQARALIQLV